MIEQQPITVIDKSELVERAAAFAREQYRLVQISCVAGADSLEVTYSFDKAYAFMNLRVVLPLNGAAVPSITGSYLAAFTYENELQDLFGIKVENLAVNYNGKFYITAVKTPFLKKQNG